MHKYINTYIHYSPHLCLGFLFFFWHLPPSHLPPSLLPPPSPSHFSLCHILTSQTQLGYTLTCHIQLCHILTCHIQLCHILTFYCSFVPQCRFVSGCKPRMNPAGNTLGGQSMAPCRENQSPKDVLAMPPGVHRSRPGLSRLRISNAWQRSPSTA